jgi:glutathione S-transferase
MTSITLYTAPRTCGKLPLILLEEIGVPFETCRINMPRGGHKSPEFKRINPKGKVPALIIDGECLTENVAITFYLNDRFPDAQILPPAANAMALAGQIADLCFCSSTLHPFVTRTCMPMFFASPESADDVRAKAAEGAWEYFNLVDDQLASGPWWYGDCWSAMDAYLYWVYQRLTSCGFDADSFPHFAAHNMGMEERPSVQRANAREAIDLADFEAEMRAAGAS